MCDDLGRLATEALLERLAAVFERTDLVAFDPHEQRRIAAVRARLRAAAGGDAGSPAAGSPADGER